MATQALPFEWFFESIRNTWQSALAGPGYNGTLLVKHGTRRFIILHASTLTNAGGVPNLGVSRTWNSGGKSRSGHVDGRGGQIEFALASGFTGTRISALVIANVLQY